MQLLQPHANNLRERVQSTCLWSAFCSRASPVRVCHAWPVRVCRTSCTCCSRASPVRTPPLSLRWLSCTALQRSYRAAQALGRLSCKAALLQGRLCCLAVGRPSCRAGWLGWGVHSGAAATVQEAHVRTHTRCLWLLSCTPQHARPVVLNKATALPRL